MMIFNKLKHLYNADKRFRFILVGVLNTFIGYLVFIVFDYLFSHFFSSRSAAYMISLILSNVLSITSAYFFHKYFTFKSGVRGIHSILEYFRFSVTYLFTFFLSIILMLIFVELLHFSPRLAMAPILGICTILSYLGHSRFSFK
jgi:putative flippase GtrA